MQKRTVSVIVAVVAAALVVAALLWMHRTPAPAPAAAASATASAPPAIAPRREPRPAPRASISGTVTDDTKAPAAGVRVCADPSSAQLPAALQRDPICATTDARGAYTLASLYPATYAVFAGGKPYLPAEHSPDLRLAAGEAKTGVDLVLLHGGALVTGTVGDIGGGPIAHARVSGRGARWDDSPRTPPVETDDAGAFALWLPEGPIAVTARADGYVTNTARGRGPGTLDVLLTPESVVSGTVVDARTGAAVPDAPVVLASTATAERHRDVTDEQGKFRIVGISPGRFVATAQTPDGYGRSEGSTLVGLGQHVDGVVVRLFPAARIEGRVMIATSPPTACAGGVVSLYDAAQHRDFSGRSAGDGAIHIDGVLPATYTVYAACPKYVSRDTYGALVVGDKPLTGLVWEVAPGATVRGKVATRTGEPVTDGEVWTRSIGGAARATDSGASARTAPDGAYELTGLRAGDYALRVASDLGVSPPEGVRVTVGEGASITRDLVLDAAGTIAGAVVDEAGQPVAGAKVRSSPLAAGMTNGSDETTTDAAGAFKIEGVRPGDYRVVASLGQLDELRRAGATADARPGELATVKPSATTTVHLVVEARASSIAGSVVDADGKPVPDAYVSSVRESDAAGARSDTLDTLRDAWGDERPVLTATDGTFVLGKLAKGTYTVRASRKGGGEAVAHHVATGSRAQLTIAPTGSLAGRAHLGLGAAAELTIEVADTATGFTRAETFYRTDGAFAIHDVPPGHFTITATTSIGQKAVVVDLASGEAKTGIDIALDLLVDIVGRVVERGTTNPAAGLHVTAELAKPGMDAFTTSFGGDPANEDVTDEGGHFKVKRVPLGMVQIVATPVDAAHSDYTLVRVFKRIADPGTTTTVDVGDLGILKNRLKPGETRGDLGVHFAELAPDTAPDQHTLKVAWIDPAGPAAKVGLLVGDVIVAIDGNDITGERSMEAWTLLGLPPGASVALVLARGATVTVVLAAP